MSLETFQRVFEKLPPTLTQIAFGIGSIDANPDLWAIFQHCREHGVVPNVTINGDRMTDADYDRLVELCGAVAVSRYELKDVCYNAVQELTSRGMQQVNIHMVLAEETYGQCRELLQDAATDSRLEKLNAIVFLALKPTGRGVSWTPLADTDRYRQLVEEALAKKIGIGFDSCSAPLFLKAMERHPEYPRFEMMAEPCESWLFSLYVNVDGCVFPCSFLEEGEGIDMTTVDNFQRDVWDCKTAQEWRERLLGTAVTGLVPGCRECPKYNLYGRKAS
jgi:MoaA/NifB/PqqE/SkfB family radical SAM enzyme